MKGNSLSGLGAKLSDEQVERQPALELAGLDREVGLYLA